VWSWWQEGSVHRAAWPDADSLAAQARGSEGDGADEFLARAGVALEVTADVLREVRKAKSQAKLPMRAPVARVLVRDAPERISALELGWDDLRQAGSIELVETAPADALEVEVELAPDQG
jgi:valyl-tRNA synthetase